MLLVAAQPAIADGKLKDAYAQAAAAAKSGRAALNSAIRPTLDNIGDKELSGEDLFYAGSMAVRVRRFDEAIRDLEKYLNEPGENGAVALVNLMEAYVWRNRLEEVFAAHERFTAEYGETKLGDPLNQGLPCHVGADLNYYMALVRADRSSEAIVVLKRVLDAIGDNSEGYLNDATLLNYHSFYATMLKEQVGWEAGVEYLRTVAQPMFKDNPALDAKIRDRMLFQKLDHYIATYQYDKGLAELKATVDSFKVDDVSYRRVSHALKRFSLYRQPAPELVGHAWVGGNPTSIAEQRGNVVLLYFFWSG